MRRLCLPHVHHSTAGGHRGGGAAQPPVEGVLLGPEPQGGRAAPRPRLLLLRVATAAPRRFAHTLAQGRSAGASRTSSRRWVSSHSAPFVGWDDARCAEEIRSKNEAGDIYAAVCRLKGGGGKMGEKSYLTAMRKLRSFPNTIEKFHDVYCAMLHDAEGIVPTGRVSDGILEAQHSIVTSEILTTALQYWCSSATKHPRESSFCIRLILEHFDYYSVPLEDQHFFAVLTAAGICKDEGLGWLAFRKLSQSGASESELYSGLLEASSSPDAAVLCLIRCGVLQYQRVPFPELGGNDRAGTDGQAGEQPAPAAPAVSEAEEAPVSPWGRNSPSLDALLEGGPKRRGVKEVSGPKPAAAATPPRAAASGRSPREGGGRGSAERNATEATPTPTPAPAAAAAAARSTATQRQALRDESVAFLDSFVERHRVSWGVGASPSSSSSNPEGTGTTTSATTGSTDITSKPTIAPGWAAFSPEDFSRFVKAVGVLLQDGALRVDPVSLRPLSARSLLAAAHSLLGDAREPEFAPLLEKPVMGPLQRLAEEVLYEGLRNRGATSQGDFYTLFGRLLRLYVGCGMYERVVNLYSRASGSTSQNMRATVVEACFKAYLRSTSPALVSVAEELIVKHGQSKFPLHDQLCCNMAAFYSHLNDAEGCRRLLEMYERRNQTPTRKFLRIIGGCFRNVGDEFQSIQTSPAKLDFGQVSKNAYF